MFKKMLSGFKVTQNINSIYQDNIWKEKMTFIFLFHGKILKYKKNMYIFKTEIAQPLESMQIIECREKHTLIVNYQLNYKYKCMHAFDIEITNCK